MWIGWAVDTTHTVVGAIVRTLLDYYRLEHPGRTPTSLWSSDEQSAYPLYDFTAEVLYRGFPATVVEVTPAMADSSLWVIKTLFASADSNGQNIQPLGLQRLYARPTPQGWRLGGALRPLTRDWRQVVAGRITYHHAPAARFDAQGGRAAARFVDSTAALLGVQAPSSIDYYLAPSFEAINVLQGFDWLLSRSLTGGKALTENRIVFSGSPALGEAFLHELAHVVLAAFGPAGDRHLMVEEGAATWLGGGNRAPDFVSYLRILVAYQEANPTAGFGDVLGLMGAGNDAPYYATGALVADHVFQRDRSRGLQQLLRVGRTNQDLLTALPTLFGVQADSLDSWWRSQPRRRLGDLEKQRMQRRRPNGDGTISPSRT